ncbi:hypothetical protein GCM10023211_21570 [Orbus sasakiae]|uniref:Uncharacterized protein n=1 Tax=Orbus sasakiae TaxID=1078475 RepID=A0ABP9NAU5_9GAMM
MAIPRFRPRPPPATILKIINELNSLQYSCNCSLDQLQKALDHLKAIKGKVDNKNQTDIY